MLFSFVHLTLALPALAAPLVTRQSCSDVTVFFARGTGEPGTLGVITGPPLKSALQSALGTQTLDFVGIDYPANVAGFLAGGDPQGAITMADNITSKANSCPNTKIVISGYSQGAQITHLAAAKLSPAVQSRVNAAVTFGDPLKDDALPGGIGDHSKVFCARLDNICAGGVVINAAHLSYGANANDAAAFVVSQV